MSLRSLFKRHLPERHVLQKHRHLRHFGELIHDPGLWHLTRRSSAGGVAVGLFCAFIPFLGQVIFAAALAILLSVNLPLAVLFAFITNPITFAPLFIFAYEVGTWILNEPTRQIAFEFTLTWFMHSFVLIWKPLVLGCLILGSFSALIGYITVRLLWRLALIRKWKQRQIRQSQKISD